LHLMKGILCFSIGLFSKRLLLLSKNYLRLIGAESEHL
jgi:hypothetical protein